MTTASAESDEPAEARSEVEDLGQQIGAVLLDIHKAYAGSQVTSGSDSQRVYGQIFADLSARLCRGLVEDYGRTDVDVRKVGHAGYRVPVIGGTLYFPWRPAGGVKPEDARFGSSTTRERLWRVRRHTDALPLFPEADDDLVPDLPYDAESSRTLAELLASDEHLRVVIVAMTATSHQVDRMEWGSAELNAEGKLVWEPVLLWDGTTRAAPAGTGAAPFDSGDAPRPAIGPKVRPEEEGGAANGSTSNA